MSSQKIQNILTLIEITENNLRNIKTQLREMQGEKPTNSNYSYKSDDENLFVEGYFDGQNMIGDDGQSYFVPQNYASKTQLIIGDRLKWTQSDDRDIYKLIVPAAKEKVSGTFAIEGDTFMVIVNGYPHPVKILKASATYAIKNLDLKVGNLVSILVPKNSEPTWGAFVGLVRENKTGFSSITDYDLQDNFLN
jgi:hypothetical protein